MNLNLKTVVLILLIPLVECNDNSLCSSPQYLELGMRGVVQCRFPDTYYGIFWYSTTDYLHTGPVAYTTSSNETGEQDCKSSEYCIDSSGSLVINNVSLQHDRNFTVVLANSTKDRYSPNNIHIIVTVRPQQSQPLIDGCNENERICFKKMYKSTQLVCRVEETRPSVDLQWFIKTAAGDHRIYSEKNETFQNPLYTTVAKTRYGTDHTDICVLYVCKTENLPSLLRNEVSMVLVQRDLHPFETIEPVTTNVQLSTSIELPCTDQPFLYLVWRKSTLGSLTEDLVDVLFTNDNFTTKFHSSKYDLISHRSLRISKVFAEEEGLYICIFGDGILESIRMYNLTAYVIPDPAYPVIEGCSHQRHCALVVTNRGVLTCSLKGIRPKVKLRWDVVEDHQKSFITFSNNAYVIRETGFTWDIFFTSDFTINGRVTGQFPIRCTAWNYGDIPFNLSTEADLLLFQGSGDVNSQRGGANIEFIIVIVMLSAVIIMIVMLFIIMFVILFVKVKMNSKNKMRSTGKSNNTPSGEVGVQVESIHLLQMEAARQEMECNL